MVAKRTLAGKIVLVTGAARGIGLATATRLHAAGARPMMADLDEDVVTDAAARMSGAPPSYRLDIAQPQSFREVADAVERDHGPIDALINNAGIMPIGHFDEESDAATAGIVDVNLLGTIYCTREAYRRMRPRGAGHIVNVASVAGRIGSPGLSTYSATKFGVYGYTEAARSEARGSGVDFSVVLPGVIDTRLSAGMTKSRMARSSSPDAVAAVIIETLVRPKFEVYIPKSARALVATAAVMPKPLLDRIIGWAGGDRAILDAVGSPQRAEYEDTIALGWQDARKTVKE
ncbi:SDR family NAD(P)-dependent oxidoreductase [Mycobacterium sp. NPDC003449]